MSAVKATIQQAKYATTLATDRHQLLADEPTDLGGTDLGFSPYELLSASLASCTAITLRMYADRKEWEVPEINVEVSLERDSGGQLTQLSRTITVQGQLSAEQRARLEAVANACPTHKVLTGSIHIQTKLI